MLQSLNCERMLGAVFWIALMNSFCRVSFCFLFPPGSDLFPSSAPSLLYSGCPDILQSLPLLFSCCYWDHHVFLSHTRWATAFLHRWAKLCFLYCSGGLQLHTRSYYQSRDQRSKTHAWFLEPCWTKRFKGDLVSSYELMTWRLHEIQSSLLLQSNPLLVTHPVFLQQSFLPSFLWWNAL